MRAATLSIGDELALGQIDDTNARWLADRLAELGLYRDEHRTVADDVDAIERAMRELAAGGPRDVLVVTGGLGPTADDLTRDALNRCCDHGAPMVEDPLARADLDRWFRGRGRAMPTSNLVQALRPQSAVCLRNPNGTAPGLAASIEHAGGRSTRIFCLPGPPREMQPMFVADVEPHVRSVARGRAMPTVAVHSFGQGESTLAERLGPLMDRTHDPSIGTTASRSIVTARIRTSGAPDEARAKIDAAARLVEERWAPYAYARDGRSLASVVVELLRERRATLAVAESCTGGLVGSMITEVAGSSDVFLGGGIVYANQLKTRFARVDPSLLEQHGAVSEEVAAALALGIRSEVGATWGIGITGIAGPGGGTATKPVGTVFIGRSGPDGTQVRRFQMPGERDIVRDRSAKSALQWLRFALLGVEAPFLWGVERA
jgi:nicotinamide-nucleotide amidase